MTRALAWKAGRSRPDASRRGHGPAATARLDLASLFGSFLQPLAIMLSLLLSFLGVVLALFVTGGSLNVMSMIGIIMLMGLVTKNGT